MRPLRILYVAIDQTVPGTLGGSVHVHAVAEGLSRLGHEVHVAVRQGGPWPAGRVVWHDLSAPFGKPALRWLKRPAVANLARKLRPNLVMERYYNFGGEGVWAARALGVPSVLEVNAPVIDHPGSRKAQFDRLMLVKPMERWRNRLVKDADLFVTPSASILPDWVDSSKVLEVEWGADVDAFTPGAAGDTPVARDPSRVTCVFAGAFRSWHGADILARALARLHAKGDTRFGGLFVGEGPERALAERDAAGIPGVRFTGALPHSALPATLAHVDIGVAPFEPSRHAPLELGFYWSPLKIFEYMAAGLPVVAPSLPRLRRLVQHGHEGWLYDPSDPVGLDKALVALADAGVRRRLGAAARVRAVRDFSWTAHCVALDARLRRLVHA